MENLTSPSVDFYDLVLPYLQKEGLLYSHVDFSEYNDLCEDWDVIEAAYDDGEITPGEAIDAIRELVVDFYRSELLFQLTN